MTFEVVRVGGHARGEFGDHAVDLFLSHLGRGAGLCRVQCFGVAEQAIADSGQEWQQKQQRDSDFAARMVVDCAAWWDGAFRFDFFKQAALNFALGLLEIGLGQDAFGLRSAVTFGARRPSQSGGKTKAATTTIIRVAKMANWVISG